MAEASASRAGGPRERGRPRDEPRYFAALDLGTNNCRLLIASPAARGFRIVDAFSRIVRLGEGLSQTGRLSEQAMERAIGALRICADRISRRGVVRTRAVATQACRMAENGPEFLAEVERRTGLKLTVITPREEARLAVAGCLDLLDPTARAALVVDVGGGSTELSWIDLRAGAAGPVSAAATPETVAWLSVPIGVVTLAERHPEPSPSDAAWYEAMVKAFRSEILAFDGAQALRPVFQEGRGHLVGTSGAITSLAGLHLGLPRYDRARVDGLWMTPADCDAVTARLAAMTQAERAALACVGPDRADLVLAGAAILQAVQETWPCQRVRVADRGLREGLLMSLMNNPRRRRRRGSAR